VMHFAHYTARALTLRSNPGLHGLQASAALQHDARVQCG
jgi:hypothetical protein